MRVAYQWYASGLLFNTSGLSDAFNHKETLMNYLQDGRCEISNNAAERRVKSYVMGRKNFLFHNTVDGARASATVLEKKCLSPAKKQVQ